MKKDSDDIPLKKSEPKKNKDSVFRFGAEARKTVSDRIEFQEKERSKKEFKCELCDYSCEKFATLKKHINSRHTEQKCKICNQEFKTSMEVVIHVAKDHQEEEKVKTSTPKTDRQGKQPSFVLSDSMHIDAMLDEFLKGDNSLQYCIRGKVKYFM